MIVVAGEALVDVIARRDESIDTVPGGGPFNTVRAVGRLGVPVAFAGALSLDEHGNAMARSLAADGVSLDLRAAHRPADDPGVRRGRRARRGALPVRRGGDIGTGARRRRAPRGAPVRPRGPARGDPGSRLRADREHDPGAGRRSRRRHDPGRRSELPAVGDRRCSGLPGAALDDPRARRRRQGLDGRSRLPGLARDRRGGAGRRRDRRGAAGRSCGSARPPT